MSLDFKLEIIFLKQIRILPEIDWYRGLIRNPRAQSEIRNHERDQLVSVQSEPSVPPLLFSYLCVNSHLSQAQHASPSVALPAKHVLKRQSLKDLYPIDFVSLD